MVPPAYSNDQRAGAEAGVALSRLSSAPNTKANLQSCQFCRKRKIKCDKLEGGCSQCSRAQNECIYPASQRKGRPRKAGTNRPTPAPTPREAQLLRKIHKLERLVVNLAGGSLHDGSEVNIDTMDHFDVGGDGEASRTLLGRLLISKPYLSDSFWSNQLVADALKNSDEESINGDEDEDEDGNCFGSARERFIEIFPANFILDVNQPANLVHFHPPPSQVQTYWRLYLENCEVLFHIFHAPTTSKIVDQAQADVNGLNRSNELIMFAIYFATITTMSEEEVLTILGGDKALLHAQYQIAVQKALVNAGFLNTQDLAVLQALVLYLVSIRSKDSSVVWTMTGLAIRIACGMGVHRDGELFKLKPLESELRRRVWHHIALLDLRASEAKGTFPTHLSYDTKLPLNINDDDLGAETIAYPEPRVGLTDMTASLVRLEFSDITRLLHKTSPMASRDKMIKDFIYRIETNYLQYCYDAGKFERWCAVLARLVMKRMLMMVFMREKDVTQATSEHLFLTSIDVVDLANQLRNDDYSQRWHWAIRTELQWHAMAIVLDELSAQSPSVVTERAWKVIDAIKWEEPEDRGGRILWQSAKKLLNKAQTHRRSQTNTIQVARAHLSQPRSPRMETYFPAEGAFDPALMGHNYYGPFNYVNIESHHPAPYYLGQHVSLQNIGHEQPVANWYFDSNAIQPLSQQEPIPSNTENWKGWDMMRDPMQGGPD